MAAYSVVARWLLDEASTGSGPSSASDQTGNGNTLTIDYNSGDAEWTSIAGGNGVDFTSTACTTGGKLELSGIDATGNIGSSFDSVTEASCIFVADIDAGDPNAARIFQIGTASGNGDLGVVHYGSNLAVRWDYESGASGDEVWFPGIQGAGLTVVHIVFDTTQATASDRVKVYYDGVQQSDTAGTYPDQNVDLSGINASSRYMTIGNRNSKNRNVDGRIYYLEIGTGQLTPTQISDTDTALSASNDDPALDDGGGVTPIPPRLHNIDCQFAVISAHRLNGVLE
jgi:hypothetical protein